MNKRTSESEIRNRGNIPVSLRRRRRYAGATGKEEAARETATDGLMEWGQRKVKHMARSDTWRRRCMWHCFKKHRRYESASDIRDLWCAINLVWLIDYWLHTVFVSVLSLASRFGHTPFSCRLRFVCNDVIHKTYMMFTDMFCMRPEASVNVQNTSLAHACSNVAAIWNTAYASRRVLTFCFS